MAVKTSVVEYQVDGVRYVGELALSEAGDRRRPGVLVAPSGGGLDDTAKSVASRLAGLGYVALAMDYYGEGRRLSGEELGVRLGALQSDPQKIRKITAEALKALVSAPETDAKRLAAIGFCYGGTAVLELARSGADLKAVVGFHSGLKTARPDDASAIKAKVLVLIGADDPIVPPADRAAFEAEMKAGGADWQMHLYGGVGHSFTNPNVKPGAQPGMAYNAQADRRSWAAMRDLFDEVFV
jgi:dienelactone hydrolase